MLNCGHFTINELSTIFELMQHSTLFCRLPLSLSLKPNRPWDLLFLVDFTSFYQFGLGLLLFLVFNNAPSSVTIITRPRSPSDGFWHRSRQHLLLPFDFKMKPTFLCRDWWLGYRNFTKPSSLGLGGLPPSSTNVILCSHWLDELIISGQIDLFFLWFYFMLNYTLNNLAHLILNKLLNTGYTFLAKLSRQRLYSLYHRRNWAIVYISPISTSIPIHHQQKQPNQALAETLWPQEQENRYTPWR